MTKNVFSYLIKQNSIGHTRFEHTQSKILVINLIAKFALSFAMRYFSFLAHRKMR